MKNEFCFLKGLVSCDSGRIQDCKMKHLNKCPKEQEKPKEVRQQAFCYLKGMVDCQPCDVQDCNVKRLNKCPKER